MQLLKEIIQELKNLFILPKKKRSQNKKSDRKLKKKVILKRRTPARVSKSATKKPARKNIKKRLQIKSPQKKKVSPKPKRNSSLIPRKKTISKNDTNSPFIGAITHYFSKINVVVIKIEQSTLKLGDKINIKGKSSDFIQKVNSLQIESVDVKSAKRGQLVGLKVSKPAQVGDKIYKLS